MEVEIRAVIHYFFLKGRPPSSAHAEITSVYGAGCISYSGVRYWYQQFRQGRTTLETACRTGRPCDEEKIDDIKELLQEMPFASAHTISSLLCMSRKQVTRILKLELGLTKKHSRWVPHFLTDIQKEERVRLSTSMLKLLQSLGPKQRAAIVTGDESWFYLKYSFDSKWCTEDERPEDIAKRLQNEEKFMIFASFNCNGLVYLDALPTNTKFNSTYMCNHILEGLNKASHETVEKITKHSKILHIDNARPHNSKMTNEKIKQLGWKRLAHPPYSPDISPCDFFLFGYLKEELRSMKLTSLHDLLNAIEEIIKKIDIKVWQSVYESWIRRLSAVIECNGDYPIIY